MAILPDFRNLGLHVRFERWRRPRRSSLRCQAARRGGVRRPVPGRCADAAVLRKCWHGHRERWAAENEERPIALLCRSIPEAAWTSVCHIDHCAAERPRRCCAVDLDPKRRDPLVLRLALHPAATHDEEAPTRTERRALLTHEQPGDDGGW